MTSLFHVFEQCIVYRLLLITLVPLEFSSDIVSVKIRIFFFIKEMGDIGLT